MKRARGFTLIEVLVATAVIALGLGAFISGGARYADYARYIHDKTIAQWVARNQLVAYQIAEHWPDTGSEDDDVDMGGASWHWVADIKDSPDPNVRRIDIHVYRVDPDSGHAEADPITLLSGFVTDHKKAADVAGASPGGAADSNNDAATGVGSR